jgi:hypothetical protein
MNRKITRTKDNRYCTVDIKITDGQLSICGEEGEIISPKTAKKMALEYWESYFEEMPSEIFSMNQRFGKKFTSAKGAAKFVIQSDGKYHGLDATVEGDKVYILESCGQITDTISDFFPEVAPLLRFHMNHMRPGCEHQSKLNWGHGKTIALTKDTVTEAQRHTIESDAMQTCQSLRDKQFAESWELITNDSKRATNYIRAARGGAVCVSDVEDVMRAKDPRYRSPMVTKVKEYLRQGIEIDIQPKVFEAEIYKDCLGVPCPSCGVRFGSQWFKEELPPEIIQLAETVCSEEVV